MAADDAYQCLTEHDAIWLIILDPSTHLDSPLHCTLLITSLSRYMKDLVDKFTALPYLWGRPQRTHPMIIDGKTFHITASLDSALRRLRDPVRKRQIWADAICNNQNDIEERNQEVGQMGSVYATAEHTVIYLGEGSPETYFLLNRLQSTCGSAYELAAFCSMAETIKFSKLLLNRPWLKSVWVLQELVLSRDPWIQCGTYLIQWKELEDYFCYLESSYQLSEPNFFKMVELRSAHLLALISPPKTSDAVEVAKELLDLLISRRGLGAADPRDVLFAIVHLVISETRLDLEYIINLSVTDERWAKWEDWNRPR